MAYKSLPVLFTVLILDLGLVIGLCKLVSAPVGLLEPTPTTARTVIQIATYTPTRTPIATKVPDDLLTATWSVPITSTLEVTGALTTELEPSLTPTFGVSALGGWCVPWNAPSSQAQVTQVIDGVTIEVLQGGERAIVRYIGVDLPVSADEPSAPEKSLEVNRRLVEGKAVLLIRDKSDTDAQGRLLRYVFVGVVFVNQEMAASGYAVARKAPEEPNEMVEIRNTSAWPVQMLGWKLSDIENHTFIFPDLTLGPGQYCRVYTNGYVVGLCNFSFWSPAPIWENDGDCAYLHDAAGNLVDTFCYD
jgi:endonuclease YncB( thermonuclease family)